MDLPTNRDTSGTQILCPVCDGAITHAELGGVVAFHGPCWERLRAAVGPLFLSTVLGKLRAGVS